MASSTDARQGEGDARSSTAADGTADAPTTGMERWKAALVGGLVSAVSLPLFPVSLAAGGAVAGYLRRGDTMEGVVVGALAGLPPTLPFTLGVLYFLDATTWRVGFDPGGSFTVLEALYGGILLLMFVPAVFAILSAVGGALGVHVRDDL